MKCIIKIYYKLPNVTIVTTKKFLCYFKQYIILSFSLSQISLDLSITNLPVPPKVIETTSE